MFFWDIPLLLTSYKPPSSPYILLTGRRNNVTWTPALRFKYAVSKLWNLADHPKENAATLLLLCGWPFPPNWAMASIVCSFCSSVLLFGNFLVSLFRMFYPRKSGQRYSSATDSVGRTELRPQLSLHCPLLILDVKQRPTVGDTPPDPPPPPSWHPPSHPPVGVGWAVTDGEVGSKYQVPWRSHFRTN